MGQPAPIPRRSSHLGSAACYGRSDHGSHSSTSAASSRSKRRQGNHNQFQTLKMFPDGHLDLTRQCEAEREITEPGISRVSRLTRALAVRNLRYRHDPSKPEVFSGIAFTLPAGSLTVLSGESGAGKSTLLDLLAGLLRPDGGDILIDGKVLANG